MKLPHFSRSYQQFAPLVARVIFGGMFLMGAAFKIPGTAPFLGEVGMSAAQGLPFAMIFVALAFLLEVVCGIAVIVGWHTRHAAFVLAVFTAALTFIFHSDFADMNSIGQFVSHLGLIAGLLYVSVYGAQSFAVSKDK